MCALERRDRKIRHRPQMYVQIYDVGYKPGILTSLMDRNPDNARDLLAST